MYKDKLSTFAGKSTGAAFAWRCPLGRVVGRRVARLVAAAGDMEAGVVAIRATATIAVADAATTDHGTQHLFAYIFNHYLHTNDRYTAAVVLNIIIMICLFLLLMVSAVTSLF